MGKHRENLWKWFSKDGRAIAPPRTLSESTQTSLINLTERHLPPDVPAQVGSTNAGPQPLVNDARLALTSAGPLQSVSASTVQETSNTSSSRATLMHFLPSVLHVAGASSKNDHGGYFPELREWDRLRQWFELQFELRFEFRREREFWELRQREERRELEFWLRRQERLRDKFFASNKWTYPSYDAFSAPLKAELLSDLPSNYETSSELCDGCLNIDLTMTLSSLHHPEERCPLCQILSKCLNKDEIKETKIPLLEAQRYVRICAVPASQDDSVWSSSIKPGLPVFLQSGSSSHFKLIKEWLRLCDEGECSESGECRPKLNAAMPTRLIDVGENKISPTVCLILTDKMRQGIHYVALSHCWGKPTEEQKGSWCTTRKNEEHRRTQGFPVKQLPQTFQDAIRVARELGQRYLWIDSLCIIQGQGGDWGTEAKKMETVFRNAYCTIAATSAEDSTKGFLNRLEESNLQYVTVPKSSHGKVYVCESIDDFSGDVDEGILNKRAWVLQERALSRRTIHFTKRQTYWECGGGVRCETLTYMRNENLSFRSDPEFPHSIMKRSRAAQVELFQSLFTDYSNFGITEVTDRPIAIDSLAMALAKAFNTNVSYGIFERYLHRSLLWQRSQDIPMRRIFYPAGDPPPSWSWMAYHGHIEYSIIQDVEWDRSVQFVRNVASSMENDSNVLEARVRRLQDCEIKSEGTKHIIRDQNDNEVGHLCFDIQLDHVIRVQTNNEVRYLCYDTQPGKAPIEVRCAIIGRETGGKDGKRKYYVLFVTECVTPPEFGKFERLGMGWIQQRFILFDGQDDVVQIL